MAGGSGADAGPAQHPYARVLCASALSILGEWDSGGPRTNSRGNPKGQIARKAMDHDTVIKVGGVKESLRDSPGDGVGKDRGEPAPAGTEREEQKSNRLFGVRGVSDR